MCFDRPLYLIPPDGDPPGIVCSPLRHSRHCKLLARQEYISGSYLVDAFQRRFLYAITVDALLKSTPRNVVICTRIHFQVVDFSLIGSHFNELTGSA